MKTILKIIAGSLVIGISLLGMQRADWLGSAGTAYAVGDIAIDWGVPAGNPIFTVSNFAPGQSQARTVEVTNDASVVRPLGVRGTPTSIDAAMADALHITITSGASTLYGPQSLTQFFADSTDPDGIPLFSLDPDETKDIVFTVLFAPSSGNEVQNKQVVFDITLGIAVETPAECTGITFTSSPIFGTDGSDSIRGTSGNDLIFGLEGSDSIRGEGGRDCIVGGPGSDSIRGGGAADILFGNEGSDSLRGEAGNDELYGGDGSDDLRGEDGSDLLRGGEGSDSLRGENGSDQLFGDAGSDDLRGGDNNDTLTGGAGNDSARGEDGRDTCDAESERTCEI